MDDMGDCLCLSIAMVTSLTQFFSHPTAERAGEGGTEVAENKINRKNRVGTGEAASKSKRAKLSSHGV